MTTGASTRSPVRFGVSTWRRSRPAPEGPAGRPPRPTPRKPRKPRKPPRRPDPPGPPDRKKTRTPRKRRSTPKRFQRWLHRKPSPAASSKPRPRTASRPRMSRLSSRSGPPTCSDCRPSTPTTASEATGTGRPRGGTLAGRLPVLDAIDQAREHDELSGGFKSVAASLQSATSRLGLVTYGDKGDPFDPKIHEALTHSYSSDVAEDTCVEILQPGYKVGDR